MKEEFNEVYTAATFYIIDLMDYQTITEEEKETNFYSFVAGAKWAIKEMIAPEICNILGIIDAGQRGDNRNLTTHAIRLAQYLDACGSSVGAKSILDKLDTDEVKKDNPHFWNIVNN